MELIPEREGGEALGAHAWAFSAVPFTEVQVCSFILYKDVFLFVEGCELQKFQHWLLEGLVATLTERNMDGNLVSSISFIYCNMQDNLQKWVEKTTLR